MFSKYYRNRKPGYYMRMYFCFYFGINYTAN